MTAPHIFLRFKLVVPTLMVTFHIGIDRIKMSDQVKTSYNDGNVFPVSNP